jgi:hypothetical protein
LDDDANDDDIPRDLINPNLALSTSQILMSDLEKMRHLAVFSRAHQSGQSIRGKLFKLSLAQIFLTPIGPNFLYCI